MALSYNNRTIAGKIDGGSSILSGTKPLPWIMIHIKTAAMVWDAYGTRSAVSLTERVVIQGKENIKSIRPRLIPGCEVLAMGQAVPAFAVANDGTTRGIVTLASILQVAEHTVVKEA